MIICLKKIMNAMSPKAEVHLGAKGIGQNKTQPNAILATYSITMSTFTNPIATIFNPQFKIAQNHHHFRLLPKIHATLASNDHDNTILQRRVFTTFIATSLALGLNYGTPQAMAENWGTRSLIREKFFEPGLSPEDAVARIRQTAEGLHSLREMLENMSWRYVLFYIRLKQSYLSQDMTNALTMVPQGQRKSYVTTANELVDNMAEFDRYVRTPKVYESYLYYEKTLKSIDDLVVFLP